MIRPGKRKYQTRPDLRAVKQQLKAFQKIQIEVKELSDIPNYSPYYLKGFARYQFTAHDVRTGACFISFARENTGTNAAIFTHLVIAHFKRCGIDLTQSHIQTDHGSKFVPPFNPQNPAGALKPSAFQKAPS